MNTVLCINGSDSMGNSGIQTDIRTIRDFGGHAVTAVTSVTVQNSQGITNVHELPSEIVIGQVRAVYEEVYPKVVKIGMVNNVDTILGLRHEVVGCNKVVCSPAILSSYGSMLMDHDSILAYCRHILPICTLLVMKCTDAEIVLGRSISVDDDMKSAADALHDMGAEWVLLRGGTYAEGRINALLSGKNHKQFFSSVNIEGWQRHGIGGTLSTAIAARLAQNDDMLSAVANAHNYMHCQVVFSSSKAFSLQPRVTYDKFMSLLSDNYTKAHDVAFYANALNISTRYLSQITNAVSDRSPKHIIDQYIIVESERLLTNTSLTIQQISTLLGFPSQIAFAKFFRHKKGNSPSCFRKSL